MRLRPLIKRRLLEGAVAKLLFAATGAGPIERIARALTAALRRGRSVWLVGNGGSAADAQHIAGELEGVFTVRRRRALAAAALTTNTSTLTAIGNDLSYEQTFARQVEAHVRRGDVLIAISTSGNAANVLAAAAAARRAGATVVGMTGRRGGKLRKRADLLLSVPSDETPRIQECHILAGHILCEAVEQALFGRAGR
jgi:D-sedoheptulose 7-phosphate isomerase